MTSFITTIQLHDADERDYKTLYCELEKQSFEGKKRIVTVLPDVSNPSEFNLSGNLSLPDAVNIIQRSVVKTGKKYSFTVIKNKLLSEHRTIQLQ